MLKILPFPSHPPSFTHPLSAGPPPPAIFLSLIDYAPLPASAPHLAASVGGRTFRADCVSFHSGRHQWWPPWRSGESRRRPMFRPDAKRLCWRYHVTRRCAARRVAPPREPCPCGSTAPPLQACGSRQGPRRHNAGLARRPATTSAEGEEEEVARS
jgi:hypothetical protein